MPGTRPTQARRRERRALNLAAREIAAARRAEDLRIGDPEGAAAKFQAAIGRLNGWQRHQWARAGYPGLRARDIAALEPFAAMGRDRR